jgi:Bacterial capsule synthesis protein PGA_cap
VPAAAAPASRAARAPWGIRLIVVAAAAVLVWSCDNPVPTPVPTPTQAASPGTSSSPTVEPSPTQAATTTFPLAVVTGITNHKGNISLNELNQLAGLDKVAVPCGVEYVQPDWLHTSSSCLPADQIVTAIESNQHLVALLPPGMVEPATKVLPISGDGPFGLFGPDLFGDPDARALPYPIQGRSTGGVALDAGSTAYDPAQVWTLVETGSLCADRGGARQAVTLGKGWDWIFNGGTAEYKGGPIPNPNPPPGIDQHPIVRPIETGNAGITATLIRRADVTLGNEKCPVMPTKGWAPCCRTSYPSLSVPEAVVPRWQEFLGMDAVYLAADHQSDRGMAGIRSTLGILDKHGIPHTGLGLDLDAALEPAYVTVAGLKVAFVNWNNVPGPSHADATTPGVAWLTKTNVNAAVARARAGGADVIICDPQWWGPDEYRPDLSATQSRAVGWMDAAGCDQILAGGLHLSGGLYLRQQADGVSAVDAGPGNFQYGQDFWQNTQEGVVVELAFRGRTLVNVRLHPYVMLLAARAALLDPEDDGHYVLDRIWKNSELDYRQ